MKADFVIPFCLLGIVSAYTDTDRYAEELYIKPLPSGLLYSHFQFTTKIQPIDITYEHYHLFPKALGEVLHKYKVQELHLSLTQGFWKADKWGYPMEEASPGAELWVWFKQKKANIDESWLELINILSGMFCASLNFMDSTNTVIPKIAFRPQGVTTQIYDKYQSQNVRYAALPKEMVCTENLTPWKKLLPCGSRAGLGTLFNSLKLYDSNYHSLGLHFRPVCRDADCNNTDAELKQTLSVVFDPTITSANSKQDWSFKQTYGRMLVTSCPVATTSKVFVDISTNKTSEPTFQLQPEPSEIIQFKRGSGKQKYAVYNVPDFVGGDNVLNLAAKYSRPVEYGSVAAPIIHAHRFQSGYGQDKGGIIALIYNNHPRRDIPISYMEVVPWFLRLYYHTLKIESFPLSNENRNIYDNGTIVKPAFTHYKPAKDRVKPYHLELMFTLPAHSVTRLSLQFERTLLKWTEYPPDANHGFYVNSAVISTLVPTARYYTAVQQNASYIQDVFEDQSTSFFLRLHTEILLITLPTPDFSMPYNVICLACTVVAIAFGSIHNLTTRNFKAIDPTKRKGLLTKIKEKIFRKKAAAVIEEPAIRESAADEYVRERGSPTNREEEETKKSEDEQIITDENSDGSSTIENSPGSKKASAIGVQKSSGVKSRGKKAKKM